MSVKPTLRKSSFNLEEIAMSALQLSLNPLVILKANGATSFLGDVLNSPANIYSKALHRIFYFGSKLSDFILAYFTLNYITYLGLVKSKQN